MAELKTKATDASVEAFLHGVESEKKREDAFAILALMAEVTGEPPKLWGSSIIGFGSYHYKYASGHEGDACLTGFSPRKQNLVLYIRPYSDLISYSCNYRLVNSVLPVVEIKSV